MLDNAIKSIVKKSYIWEKFVFCNFSHIIFNIIRDTNLECRIGNCRQLNSNVSKKLFELWIANDYIEAESNHIALLLDIEKEFYFLDPLMWQIYPISIYGWISDSIEPWAKLVWKKEWNKWILTKYFSKWERSQIFSLPKILQINPPNFNLCPIRENNDIPKENKIIFYDKNYSKNSIKYLWNLEKFELTILNTNLQIQKIILSTKELCSLEENLDLSKDTLYYLFNWLHERIRSKDSWYSLWKN